MTIDELRNELRDRDGEATVWLLYVADMRMELEDGQTRLVLRRAFFTRGEAYAMAQRLHQERRWQHYYVFHLVADLPWIESNAPREADYEFAFGRVRALPSTEVTPAQVATAFAA